AAMRYLKALDMDMVADKAMNQAYLAKAKAFGVNSSDGEHNFSLSEVDGHRTLTAKDKSGKTIFDGPIDTDEQLQKVPADIRAKVQNLSRWPKMAPGTQPFLRAPVPAKVPPTPRAPTGSSPV